MEQNVRHLAGGVRGVTCVVGAALLLGSVAFAGAALRQAPPSPQLGWSADPSKALVTHETTRIGQVTATAREIKAALAKPIAAPEPLPPITAKLAYGHLRPGRAGEKAPAQRKPTMPDATRDALARDALAMKLLVMNVSSPGVTGSRASSVAAPNPHRIY